MLTKEHGSSIEYDPTVVRRSFRKSTRLRGGGGGIRLFATARQALIALVRTLHRTSDVRQILLPDHYCHATALSVRTALADIGVTVSLYPATFGTPVEIATEPQDLIVINVPFGVPPDWSVAGRGTRILDATHAPDLALLPEADHMLVQFDYVFASLKKLLPVTDGAILKAIGSQILPPRPITDPEHEEQATELERLLHLKKRFVDGEDVDKAVFYPEAKELERQMTHRSSPCAMSEVAMRQLRSIDIAAAVGTARQNVKHAKSRLRDALKHQWTPSIEVIETQTFVALLCADAAAKQSLVRELIGHRIYPATLWPTDGLRGVSIQTQEFVDRLVVLNADLRYSTEHMASVSDLVLASSRLLEGPAADR